MQYVYFYLIILYTYLSTRLLIYLFLYFCNNLFIDAIYSCLYKLRSDSLLFVVMVPTCLHVQSTCRLRNFLIFCFAIVFCVGTITC